MILDLLGVGVPPEYLMQCGVTRELIYFTFTELRLSLPLGFDTAGIPQYSPEFLQSLFESQKHVERLDTVSPTSQMEDQEVQPAEKPSDTPSDSTSITPTTPASGSPSLLDIEQQRRRELLARKAVIASRKGKQPQTSALRTPSPHSANGSSANTPFKDKDSEMASVEIAPAATVDDFLSSIDPSEPLPPAKSESEGMDIDEIPGLGGIWVAEELSSPMVEPPPPSASTSAPSPSPLLPDTPNSIEISTGPLSSGGSTPLLPGDNIASQRLGSKRPVAADFVDAERFQSHSYSSFSNGQPHAKRRLGGFASITSARRCVIDLSDSEDEDYPEDTDTPPQQRALPPTRHGSLNTYFTAHASFKATNTPPSGINSLSGVTLLEKELEIKRMREMIAQKEQMRLRKLVRAPP